MNLKHLVPTNPRKRQLLVSAAIIGVAILTSASIFATGPHANPAAHVEKAWPVSVTTAVKEDLNPSFAAFGRLESNRVAHLRSDLIARVTQVHVKEGDWVNLGDVLVQLDDREAKLQVLQRKAELLQERANLASKRSQLDLERQSAEHFESRFNVAQAKLRRHRDLWQTRLISRALLDEVVSQANEASIEYRRHEQVLTNLPNDIAAHSASVQKAEALLEQARLDLDKTLIRAPFAGPVLAVHAAPGDHSNLSAPLLDIADAGGFEIRVQVPDHYARQFQQAMQRGMRVLARTEVGGELRLGRLAGQVKAGQTGLDAFFTVADQAQYGHTLGEVYSLSIELPTQPNLIALPVQALYENERVYGVRENRLVGYHVERVGELDTRDRGYQILVRSAEISPGERIITTQLPKAIPGLLVDVANAQSATANVQVANQES